MSLLGTSGRAGASLTQDEASEVRQRLDRLGQETVIWDFNDPYADEYTDRARARMTDNNLNPIRKDFEPFVPPVATNDPWIDSSVGQDEANHPMAVYKMKKLMRKAGYHEFKPGIEGLGEANPRFIADLGRMQAENGLLKDFKAHAGGPSVLTASLLALGPEDGKLPHGETASFQDRSGKDPSRALSDRPIFGSAEENGVSASLGLIQEAARRGGRRRG